MTQSPPLGYSQPPSQQGNGLAVASLVLGILACVTFCIWWLAIPLGAVAIVLGVVAKGKVARGESSGAGMAKAGLILGIIGVVLSLIITLLAIAGISMFGNKIRQEIERQQKLQQEQHQQQPAATEPSASARPVWTLEMA